MDLKMLLMRKGITQLHLAKVMDIHPATLSMQINKHRLLPDKHLEKFCKLLEISKESVIASMTDIGASRE